ncbi:hypothetical protein ElyMa_001524400 [Elysia marginata]|uniref:Uncharacterized protein n=1 Tax=Elysia marginata TaxID=1093978 RepID=A0AAV4JA17_9GAST|nr:hypothetical protein ElyMa_001524400 [Elysia marginata]
MLTLALDELQWRPNSQLVAYVEMGFQPTRFDLLASVLYWIFWLQFEIAWSQLGFAYEHGKRPESDARREYRGRIQRKKEGERDAEFQTSCPP